MQLNALCSGLVCLPARSWSFISLNAFLNGRSYGLYSLVCITRINTEFGLYHLSLLLCHIKRFAVWEEK